jgi:hypothetical protein
MRCRLDSQKANFHNLPLALSSDYETIRTYVVDDRGLHPPRFHSSGTQEGLNIEILHKDMGKVALRRGGIIPPYPKDTGDGDFSGVSPSLSIRQSLRDTGFASEYHSLRQSVLNRSLAIRNTKL